ncbi:MAG: hypothetical protein N5P05_001544 [Chroococcopsis gigantea SAG 12.99]|jgi:myosin heavy subunit|nr:hypothetical protein [Chlorogloea purpurea SAG 13.99]MDV2999938.1 hypothetical protein [Chroococcopsis gigantea SAG 12.99]
MNQYPSFSSTQNTIITAEIVENSEYGEDDPPSGSPDWFEVSRGLQQHNRELLQTVLKLEQSLTQSQQQIQTLNRRLRSSETLLNQQTQEMNQNQQQVNTLVQELDTCRQKIAQQNTLIAQYSQELKTSRSKIAQLEKNQSLSQEQQHESQQKLLACEQQIRELRTRLQRQQRYTLQYKAALDQCLGKEGDLRSSNVIPMVSVQPWSSSESSESETDHLTISSVSAPPTVEIAVESKPILKSSPSPKLSDWSAPTPKHAHKSSRKIDLPTFPR